MLVGVYDSAQICREIGHIKNKLIALEAEFARRGYELFYFADDQVDMEKKQVTGIHYEGDLKEEVLYPIPELVFNYFPKCEEERTEIESFLRTETFFTTHLLLDKYSLGQKLLDEKTTAPFIIEQMEVTGWSDFKRFLERHKKIILKPIAGRKGYDVLVFEQQGEEYKLTEEQHEEILSEQEVVELIEDLIDENYWMMQKYTASKTTAGLPFEIRAHMLKDGAGHWILNRGRARISKYPMEVVSYVKVKNVFGDANVLYITQYLEDYQDMLNNTYKCVLALAKVVDDIHEEHLLEMGIDLGIDEQRNLFLIEISAVPECIKLKWESVKNLVDYFEYLFGLYDLEKEDDLD